MFTSAVALALFLIAVALFSLLSHCSMYPQSMLCKETDKEQVSAASYVFFVMAAVVAVVNSGLVYKTQHKVMSTLKKVF